MLITKSLIARGGIANFGFLLAALAANVMAQSPPGSIPVGPMFMYPEIEVAVKRDSNIALTPTGKSDTIWYLRPVVRAEAKQGVNLYDLTYRGEFGRYVSQENFDYDNNEFGANANMTFDARNKLKFGLQYTDRVDPPGTLNIAATPTPNRSHQTGMTGLYTYGAEDARAKLELQGAYINKWYINNRDLGTAGLDYFRTDYGGTFLWRVQPKTYATFNLRQSVYDYKISTSTLDSTNTYALVGARWEATRQTSGRLAMGHINKKFDDAGRQIGRNDYSSFGWEGGINWKPLAYSSVDFITQRLPVDSTGLGSFTVNQSSQILWSHAWSSRVSSNLTGNYSTDKFNQAPVAAAGGDDRRDVTKGLGFRFTYKLRRWLNAGADYTYTTRDSNDNNFNYSRNQLMFFLSGTL